MTLEKGLRARHDASGRVVGYTTTKLTEAQEELRAGLVQTAGELALALDHVATADELREVVERIEGALAEARRSPALTGAPITLRPSLSLEVGPLLESAANRAAALRRVR